MSECEVGDLEGKCAHEGAWWTGVALGVDGGECFALGMSCESVNVV